MDKYHGLRVHCWVLILSGKREVPQNFFIEPTTGNHYIIPTASIYTPVCYVCVCVCVCMCVCVSGKSYSTDSELYLGIESLWNHHNYWINMQDCAQGLKVFLFFHWWRLFKHFSLSVNCRIWCLIWETRQSGSFSFPMLSSHCWWCLRRARPLWGRRR